MDEQGRRPGDASPTAVDVHVGTRIRIRRKALGISQMQLADHLGLTFQQVQKYEKGSNRVSASKLYAIAQVLGVDPDYMFGGLPDPMTAEAGAQTDPAVRTVSDFMLLAEGPAMAQAVSGMSPANRNRVFNLLWALTSDEAAL